MIKRFITLFKESSESFDGQERDEPVVLLLRRHRFTILLPLSLLALALLPPLVAWDIFGTELTAQGLSNLFYFAASIWYLFLWLVVFYLITMYTLNTVIITDRRIIENEQRGFFNRKISELHIYRVQDVSVHVSGFLETVLHFGDIVVQTAASEKQFVFHKIPEPEKVKDAIMKTVFIHQSKMRLR